MARVSAVRCCGAVGYCVRTDADTMDGVIAWGGRILVYRGKDEQWQAHFLGEDTPVSITADLREAIAADVRHQEEKRREAD